MLSQTQREVRKGRLTASRVACLMEGDVIKIDRLYREMIGEAEPEDLTNVWAVRLGEATEQLQLDWFEQKNATLVTRRGEVVIHPQISWAACTLDGWYTELACPIECKHTGGREPFDPVIIDRYQPQIQWQMLVTNATQCALSVIMGANQPIVEFIERSNPYIAEMVLRGKQFIDCVTFGRPPVALPAAPAPADTSKIYDMTGNNLWATSARDWLDTKKAHGICEDASKILKAAVPADAKTCRGHGVRVTRDRVGRLSLREEK